MSGGKECFDVGEGCRFGYNEKIDREDGKESKRSGESGHFRELNAFEQF